MALSIDKGLKPYAVGLLLILAASALTVPFMPLFGGKAPIGLFLIAVILSAAQGGARAGFASAAGGILLMLTVFRGDVFIPPAESGIVVFALISVAISVVVGKLHRANTELLSVKTQLETANEMLSRNSANLSRSNEELRRFAFSLAHDLHSPLRNIRAFAELLVEHNADGRDETSRECARSIGDGVRRMDLLISGLLSYAAAAEAQPGDTLTDGNDVVKRVVTDLQHLIETAQANVTVGPLPAVRMNQASMAQVFANLIGNAIKYRGERQPEVSITASEQGTEWCFAVRDNGIGFDMRYREEIFEMFSRLHTFDTYEGSGIGLALCKAAVERHGGRIWVESEPGKGSTFFFAIPKTAADAPMQAQAAIPRQRRAASS